MLDEKKIKELQEFAIDIREQILRQIGKRGFGHIGGCMSIADIIAVLYGSEMNVDPKNPLKEDRDYLICSKGHAGPALYAALALKGFFPLDWMDTLNQPGTNLPSHCDRKKTPGIDVTTGSLGQGLSYACGIAFASAKDGSKRNVYCIIGDGETQEGQIWEALLFAAHNKLDNLIIIMDSNKVQLDDTVENINGLGDIRQKFEDFGFDVQSVDGHDVSQVHEAIENAKTCTGKPSVIIANTIKGKGCCFADSLACHHINVSEEEVLKAVQVLEDERKAIFA